MGACCNIPRDTRNDYRPQNLTYFIEGGRVYDKITDKFYASEADYFRSIKKVKPNDLIHIGGIGGSVYDQITNKFYPSEADYFREIKEDKERKLA